MAPKLSQIRSHRQKLSLCFLVLGFLLSSVAVIKSSAHDENNNQRASNAHLAPQLLVKTSLGEWKSDLHSESDVLTVASAPANDQCSTSQVIPSSGPFPYLTSVTDISDADIVGDPDPTQTTCPITGLFARRSVWYSFTPNQSGRYTFSTCNPQTGTTVSDTFVVVYSASGSCSGLTPLACDDDSCDLKSKIINDNFLAGTTYYIVV